MTVFRIIPKGDLALSPPDPATGLRSVILLTGAAAVKQRIATRLRFFLGEWFADLREGLPLFEVIFGQKNPSPAQLDLGRTIIRRAIQSMPEVTGTPTVLITYDPVERTIAVEFDADLVEGGTLSVHQPDPPFIFKPGAT